MKIFSPQRWMRLASHTRYYALVIGIVVIIFIILSITHVLKKAPKNESSLIPVMLASYQKIIGNSDMLPPIVLGGSSLALQYSRQYKIPFIESENEQFRRTETTNAITTESLHDEISSLIGQHESSATNEKMSPVPTAINNSLLVTLFPHRKSMTSDEPIVKPYQDHFHQGDISVIRIADKIDQSLSISALNSPWKQDLGSEADFDEYYEYDSTPTPNSYPYLPDPHEILRDKTITIETQDLPDAEQIDQLITTGDYYLLANDPIKARQYYMQAVKIGSQDKQSPFYAKSLVKLADIEENAYLARFQYTNALDIYESLLGFDLEIADILVKLVWTFDMATERIVIYELLTKAKAILENHAYSPQYTEVLRNLAIYYETVDNFEQADANYQAALAIDLQYLTASDIRTVLALENYASFYLKYHEYDKAEEILQFKLTSHQESSPPDYYNLGRTESMLGWTNLQQNDLDDALHYYNSALGNINYSITKNRFMPHYYSLPAIFDIVHFFIQTQEPERAEPYFPVILALLESENEEYILDYLKTADRAEITGEDIVHYSWAFDTEVDGIIALLEHLDQKEIDLNSAFNAQSDRDPLENQTIDLYDNNNNREN